MTEQDVTEETTAEAEAEAAAAEEPGEADLEDIAEAPEGNPEAAFEAILEQADGETADVDAAVTEELREHVESTDQDVIATELATLQARIETLQAEVETQADEIDDLESRLARKQADFQNYKKRQKERMEEEKQRATEDLVGRLLDVRDNLARALDQDADADIRDGIESTLQQFDAELDRENVDIVEPEPGDAVDPQRHEVLMRVESEQAADTIDAVHRPGYEMAGKVLRTAQVTVSDGSGDDAAADGAEDADDTEE